MLSTLLISNVYLYVPENIILWFKYFFTKKTKQKKSNGLQSFAIIAGNYTAITQLDVGFSQSWKIMEI